MIKSVEEIEIARQTKMEKKKIQLSGIINVKRHHKNFKYFNFIYVETNMPLCSGKILHQPNFILPLLTNTNSFYLISANTNITTDSMQ